MGEKGKNGNGEETPSDDAQPQTDPAPKPPAGEAPSGGPSGGLVDTGAGPSVAPDTGVEPAP